MSEGIATPCSDRSFQPFTVTISPEFEAEFEAPEVIEALHFVPQLDADFFEEPVDVVVSRLMSLSLERNG